MTRRDELEDFKTRINLTEYAAANGYCLDRRASCRNSVVMRRGAGDKIIVAVDGHDRHWVYFAVHDERDNGSIIDFCQRRQGGSLGEVRKTLRPWLDGASALLIRPSALHFATSLEPITRDLAQVRARYEAMRPESCHPYLEEGRKIPPHVLADPLFEGRIRIDDRNNAVFPHFNRDGLCGYELKNRGFTGFAPGGQKGLWASRLGSTRGDVKARLIVAETAIDALSHFAIKGEPGSRYVSTAGELNPDQPLLLQEAMWRLSKGGKVVLAVDHDAGGEKIGARLEGIFAQVNRPDLILTYDRPPVPDTDWNDVLRASGASPLSIATLDRPTYS